MADWLAASADRNPSLRTEKPTRDAFADDDGRKIGICTGDYRHDRTVGDEHVLQPMNPAPRVGDRQGFIGRPHRTCANRVVVVLDGALDPLLYRCVILDRRSRTQLRAKMIAQPRLGCERPRHADSFSQHRSIVSLWIREIAMLDLWLPFRVWRSQRDGAARPRRHACHRQRPMPSRLTLAVGTADRVKVEIESAR